MTTSNQSILDKPIVLKLNSLWQRIGFCTPRQAFVSLCGGAYGGTPPGLALSVETDENGELVEAIPMDWDRWKQLPIRDCDLSVSTKDGAIRCPSILITPVYSGMPLKAIPFNSETLRKRDGDRCAVTGRKLAKGEGNMGHIIARAKGGKRTWENIVYMDAKLNSLQGTKTPEEMGWDWVKPRPAPLPAPACARITETKHQDHAPFVRS